MILVTGANGQLGQMVIAQLLQTLDPSDVVAAVRRPDAASALHALGVTVRHADYDAPHTWPPALEGVTRVLLIATSDIGRREQQHRVVVDAVTAHPGIELLAYTSLLQLDTSTYVHAASDKAIETLIEESGIDHVFLRHGWYTENYAAMATYAAHSGSLYGATQHNLISAASRIDYAAAAARVLTTPKDSLNTHYELAGDVAFTLDDLAREITAQTHTPVTHIDVTPAELEQYLATSGYPADVAATLADADRVVAAGELHNTSGELARLIGRPTTTLAAAVTAALAAADTHSY